MKRWQYNPLNAGFCFRGTEFPGHSMPSENGTNDLRVSIPVLCYEIVNPGLPECYRSSQDGEYITPQRPGKKKLEPIFNHPQFTNRFTPFMGLST